MYKIFVDAHVFDGEYQGTLTYLKELYLDILKRGRTDIDIYFGSNNISNTKKIFSQFEHAHFIKYNSKNSFKRIFSEIPQIIKELKCTHAHFQYIIPKKKVTNCKYMVTIHDVLFNDFKEDFSFFYKLKRNILFNLSAKRSDFLFTVSNYSKLKIAEHYNINLNKILITPNAVSDDFFNFNVEKEISEKYIYDNFNVSNFILYVSRIEPRKNQKLLLDTYISEKLYDKNLSLVFIGSNTLDSDFEITYNNLNKNIKNNIFWFEQVDFLKLKHFINATKLFVYPTKAEGFGIPPLEAAVLLTPVICANVTAMEDFDFFEPYMFNPDNKDEFKLKLLTIIDELDKINTFEIRDKIKEKYSWHSSANVILNTLTN